MVKNLICLVILALGSWATSSFSQEKVSAQYYYQRADSIANSLLDEINHIILKSEDVDTLGRSDYWIYAYQNLYMYFSADSQVIDTTFGEWTGSSFIQKGWFDSDSAVHIAEENGGREFRRLFSDYKIFMDLGHDSASPWTTWWIIYSSATDKKSKIDLTINALNGTIIYNWSTGIDRPRQPKDFSLFQNHPNPFNAQTTITYHIPKSSRIKLAVYNTTGQLVDVLVDEQKSAGSYTTIWDGSQFSSGLYFYKMSSAHGTVVKKLLLVK